MDDASVYANLDPCAAGENFFLTLKSNVKKMGRKLERDVHYIRFTTEKEAAGAACHAVNLNEDVVNDDWEGALEWIKLNKEKAPYGHLFGMIEQADDG